MSLEKKKNQGPAFRFLAWSREGLTVETEKTRGGRYLVVWTQEIETGTSEKRTR